MMVASIASFVELVRDRPRVGHDLRGLHGRVRAEGISGHEPVLAHVRRDRDNVLHG